ncbi:MAG: acyl carrier protein [Acutalibacteraceae bacterium]|jgi:hypothetical protein
MSDDYGDYGYFGSGLDGYVHYTQSFNDIHGDSGNDGGGGGYHHYSGGDDGGRSRVSSVPKQKNKPPTVGWVGRFSEPLPGQYSVDYWRKPWPFLPRTALDIVRTELSEQFGIPVGLLSGKTELGFTRRDLRRLIVEKYGDIPEPEDLTGIRTVGDLADYLANLDTVPCGDIFETHGNTPFEKAQAYLSQYTRVPRSEITRQTAFNCMSDSIWRMFCYLADAYGATINSGQIKDIHTVGDMLDQLEIAKMAKIADETAPSRSAKSAPSTGSPTATPAASNNIGCFVIVIIAIILYIIGKASR